MVVAPVMGAVSSPLSLQRNVCQVQAAKVVVDSRVLQTLPAGPHLLSILALKSQPLEGLVRYHTL